MKKLLVGSSLLLLTPAIVFAQDLQGALTVINRIVSDAMPIMVGLALLFFFWGLARYILAAGDEEKKKEGRSIMVWGVIAIFVILSIFGLVRVLQETFSIEQDTQITPGTATPPKVNR